MSSGDVTVTVEAEDEAALASARDVAAEALVEHGYVVTATASAVRTQKWRVSGVDADGQPFSETMEGEELNEVLEDAFEEGRLVAHVEPAFPV